MKMYEYFQNKHYKIGVLCFDGLMIETADDEETKSILNELKNVEKFIKDEEGYEIELTEKSMDTDWRPNIIEKEKEEIFTFSYDYIKQLDFFHILLYLCLQY